MPPLMYHPFNFFSFIKEAAFLGSLALCLYVCFHLSFVHVSSWLWCGWSIGNEIWNLLDRRRCCSFRMEIEEEAEAEFWKFSIFWRIFCRVGFCLSTRSVFDYVVAAIMRFLVFLPNHMSNRVWRLQSRKIGGLRLAGRKLKSQIPSLSPFWYTLLISLSQSCW